MLTDENAFGEIRSYLAARESPSLSAFTHLELLVSCAGLSARTEDMLYVYLEGCLESWEPSSRRIWDLGSRGSDRARFLGLVRRLSLREVDLQALWDRPVFQNLMYLDIYSAQKYSLGTCRQILSCPHLQNLQHITFDTTPFMPDLIIDLLGVEKFAPHLKTICFYPPKRADILPFLLSQYISASPDLHFEVTESKDGISLTFTIVRS